MRTVDITSSTFRRASCAALALLLLSAVVAWSSTARAATSPAVNAAQAQGTPVIKPPAKAKPKPLTCKVSRRLRGCRKKTSPVCTKRGSTKTCRYKQARCRLDRRTKRCTITTVRCTITTKRKRCVTTFRKLTATQAFAVRASQAIPRFLSRPVPSAEVGRAAATAAVKLVSSRPGTPAAAGPMVPVATSQQPQASGIGAGIGALVLAFVLMSIMLVRRRPRGDA